MDRIQDLKVLQDLLIVEAVSDSSNVNNQNSNREQLTKEEKQNQGFSSILGTEVEKLKEAEAEEKVKTK